MFKVFSVNIRIREYIKLLIKFEISKSHLLFNTFLRYESQGFSPGIPDILKSYNITYLLLYDPTFLRFFHIASPQPEKLNSH